MTTGRWRQIEEVYEAVVARPEPERPDLLVRLCGNDEGLRAEVESLLAHAPAASAFLETPAIVLASATVSGEEEPPIVGRRFGTYLVGPPLGAGGMGEVYRAHDERLGRNVAIKILGRLSSNDPERRERFEREARILAALNHPHIGAIYGHADVDGSLALVLELVDGETLAERMSRSLTASEALATARAIAEALEAAHERGIIHRDLKPANIKITRDGVVKVLDFGLAKLAAEPSDEAIESGARPLHLPTSTPHDTRDGVILGTIAYMSPEQAVGQAVDKRSDLWAFGVVLLEMLTGRPAFPGKTNDDVLAAVIRAEPDMTLLPPETPAAVRKLLRRCLEKDRKRRLDSATAVRLEIEDALATPVAELPGGSAALRWNATLIVAALAALVLVAAGSAWILSRPAPELQLAAARFAIVTPPAQPLNVSSSDRDLALSPNGRHLVYRAAGSTTNGSPLFLRAIDELDARPIRDVVSAYSPFFSPDSQWIGFFENAQLKKVSVTGGPIVTLGAVIGEPLGGSWGDDDTIVFATDDRRTGLWRIPAEGGDPMVVTTPDAARQESDHAFPAQLPGGRGVLFTITAPAGPADGQVAWLDLKTGARRTLVRGGSHAEYIDRSVGSGQRGYLIYAADNTLRAVRFDPVQLDLFGDPVAVLEHVMMKPLGSANYSVSGAGAVIYVPEGAVTPTPITLPVWVERTGREVPIDAPPRAYGPPRLSPDGTRMAVGFPDQGDTEIWILDLAHATTRRLTFSRGMDGLPRWSPDGRRIVFMSTRAGALNWYTMAADGGGRVDRLTSSTTDQWPISISPDGTRVFGFGSGSATRWRVIVAPLIPATVRPPPAELGVEDLFEGRFPEISPNGRYLAYTSTESGRDEIYVRAFPQIDHGRWQVSAAGGTRAAWEPSGRELFYLDASNTLTVVAVQTAGPTFVAGKPAHVFETKYAQPNPARHYDISPNGRRFLMLKPRPIDATATPASMVIIEHWFEELKSRVR